VGVSVVGLFETGEVVRNMLEGDCVRVVGVNVGGFEFGEVVESLLEGESVTIVGVKVGVLEMGVLVVGCLPFGGCDTPVGRTVGWFVIGEAVGSLLGALVCGDALGISVVRAKVGVWVGSTDGSRGGGVTLWRSCGLFSILLLRWWRRCWIV